MPMKFLWFFLVSASLYSYNTLEIRQILAESFSGRLLFGDLFELKINGHPIRVHIRDEKIPNSTTIIIAPIGIEITEESMDNSCLFLNITPANKGHLSWISTKDELGVEQKCGLPASILQKGTFLLHFVDQVAHILRLSLISLTDDSNIWCPKNKKLLSLRMLNLLKNKPSWYGQNGYLPADKTEYLRSRTSLINMALSDVLDKINQIDSAKVDQLIKDYNEMLTDKKFEESTYPIYQTMKYWEAFTSRRKILNLFAKDLSMTTFSDLAQNMYGKNGLSCDVYSEVIDLVFPPLIEDKSLPTSKEFQDFFPWYKDYEVFDSTGLRLTKTFKKHKRQENDQKD